MSIKLIDLRRLVTVAMYCVIWAAASHRALAQAKPPATAQQVVVYQVYLASGGCEPREVHAPAGKVHLYVVNLHRRRDLNVYLHPENGVRISSKQLSDKDNEWLDVFDLSKGIYLIEADNDSEHHCRLIVE